MLTTGAVPERGPLADPALLGTVVRGLPDVPQDADGLIRRVGLLVPSGGRLEPAFGLRSDVAPARESLARVIARLGAPP